MSLMEKKLLVVCGPTAIGKTSVGLKVAVDFNGELVSADSRQVYRGMDIGTGKDVGEARFEKVDWSEKYNFGFYQVKGVKLWGCDLVEPDYPFSAVDFIFCARKVIEDIWQRGKLPVLVGGTGLYLKALFQGLDTMAAPDWDLREKLSNWPVARLKKRLKKLSLAKFEALNRSDVHNPRRLIRAIEIVSAEEKEKTASLGSLEGFLGVSSLWLGLKLDFKLLYPKIDQRVDERVKAGMEKEIKELLRQGYHWQNSVLGTTLGYHQWQDFFKGKMNRSRVVEKWQFAEHAFARRQMTWFKKQKQIDWFDLGKKDRQKGLARTVAAWYDRIYAEDD